jgi:salicylate hydroxylase
MARSRSIIIAGAGIGGLTAALALTRAGFRAVVLERAERLEEAGAGIQLSPNATRVLADLGLAEKLRPHVVAPEAIRITHGRSGREIVRIPLGRYAEQRYGAPYWVIHRADLQAVLATAIEQSPDVTLRLGTRVEDFAVHQHGVTVQARTAQGTRDEQGIALIGADGLWSALRTRLGERKPPRFANRTAWRAVVPAALRPEFREPVTGLWLGRDAHLVHYPVKAGRDVNIVAIVRDDWREQGWSAPGNADELARRFKDFSPALRALIAQPDRWQKWALFDRPPGVMRAQGPVTLLGDAAHPMLPFLAQGGAMAIEDAAVLAQCLARDEDTERPLRDYEHARRRRVARLQREARRNSARYHLSGPPGMARNAVLAMMGGERLLRRYDWLYGWRQ